MKHDHTFAEPQQLAPVYFSPPKAWWFHTSDFFIFYYILSTIIGLIVFVIMLVSFTGDPSAPTQTTDNPAVISSPESVATDEMPEGTGLETPAATEPLESASPDQVALLKSAQEQPTYALQVEAFRQLENNPVLSAEQRGEVSRALAEAEKQLQKWEKNMALAKRYIDQEYYSSAIKALAPFLEAGPVLGPLLKEAEELYAKAHTKKIDYFLLKGQLTQAKKALKEAESANLPTTVTQDYADKIKNLELAGR